jgi:spore germination protein GerM
MSEGYAIEDRSGEIVGLVVRQVGDRVFRFFSAVKRFDRLDGSSFANVRAAQNAVNDIDGKKRSFNANPISREKDTP